MKKITVKHIIELAFQAGWRAGYHSGCEREEGAWVKTMPVALSYRMKEIESGYPSFNECDATHYDPAQIKEVLTTEITQKE